MKNFYKYIVAILAITFTHTNTQAQYTRYIVKLKNKGGTPFTLAAPNTYLTAKAVARRTKYNLSIDSTDLPITPRYIDSIKAVPNVTILNVSKWLNQVAISTTDPMAIAKINNFTFVINSSGIATKTLPVGLNKNISASKLAFEILPNTITTNTTNQLTTGLNYGNSASQIALHKGDFLHDYGFLGQGMTIAMMDAGFNTVNTNTGIDSLRINNQIKGTWDFVAREASVNEDDAHGFYCLSIIGANKPGQMIGSAPKANFYLYRTEDVASEYPIEEQNWAAAAELADSLGVDVFSTSLGYIDFDDASFDYTYAQRNGNTAIMTRAADLAAKKGIIVCNSAGNNGNSNAFPNYKYVAVPADGDSVVAVGACNSTGQITSFSAWGPTSSGKVKPNVTSVGAGTSFVNLGGSPSNGNGTSFSNPNIAGLITAYWQAFPEFSNMTVIDLVQQTSSIGNTPDDRYGYGLPNMKKAFVAGLQKLQTQNATINNCKATVQFAAKDNGSSTYELQRKLSNETVFTTVKTIPSISGAFALKSYTVADSITSTALGTVQYRIKHTMSTDTSFVYTTSSTVNYTTICTTAIPPIVLPTDAIVIAPNPVKTTLTIKLGSLYAANTTIKIIDTKGAVVHQSVSSTTINLINTAQWATGIYIVELINNGKKITSKKILKAY